MRPIALLKFAEKREHYNNPECLISHKIQPGIIILPEGCMSSGFRIYEHSSPISLLTSKVFSWRDSINESSEPYMFIRYTSKIAFGIADIHDV